MLTKSKVGVTMLSSTDITKVPADMERLITGQAYGDHLEASGTGSVTNPELRAHLDEVSVVVKEMEIVEFCLQWNYFSDIWRK